MLIAELWSKVLKILVKDQDYLTIKHVWSADSAMRQELIRLSMKYNYLFNNNTCLDYRLMLTNSIEKRVNPIQSIKYRGINYRIDGMEYKHLYLHYSTSITSHQTLLTKVDLSSESFIRAGVKYGSTFYDREYWIVPIVVYARPHGYPLDEFHDAYITSWFVSEHDALSILSRSITGRQIQPKHAIHSCINLAQNRSFDYLRKKHFIVTVDLNAAFRNQYFIITRPLGLCFCYQEIDKQYYKPTPEEEANRKKFMEKLI